MSHLISIIQVWGWQRIFCSSKVKIWHKGLSLTAAAETHGRLAEWGDEWWDKGEIIKQRGRKMERKDTAEGDGDRKEERWVNGMITSPGRQTAPWSSCRFIFKTWQHKRSHWKPTAQDTRAESNSKQDFFQAANGLILAPCGPLCHFVTLLM